MSDHLHRLQTGYDDHFVSHSPRIAIPLTDRPSAGLDVHLDVGVHCTGSLFPLGAAEPPAMVHRFIRHGLPKDHRTRARGACDACGLETEVARVGDSRASYLVCGPPRAWEAARERELVAARTGLGSV